MLTAARYAALLVIAALTPPAFAWNALGHKVVAEISWQELDAPRRQEIVDMDPQHGTAVLRVMVGDTIDESVQGFSHTTVPNKVTTPTVSGRASAPQKRDTHDA